MSVAKVDDNRKVTTHRLIEMKQRGEKISMLCSVARKYPCLPPMIIRWRN